MRHKCDRFWQIDALREGRLGEREAASFERHWRACEACRARIALEERLRDLGQRVALDGPSELALRRLRIRVLRDVATGREEAVHLLRQRFALAFALIAVSLGIGFWAFLRATPAVHVAAPALPASEPSKPSSQGFAGSIVPAPAARWARTRSARVERVRLDEGTVAVHVRPQQAGERFLVELPDGEIEVRGTTFDVSVLDGATARVHVDEGIVEVRLEGRPARELGAHETWLPPAREKSASAALPQASLPMVVRIPTARPVDDGSTAYASAMQLLRDGKVDDAASAFHAFALGYPHASQTEDASFLEAVALARAGRTDAAGLAAEQHLAGFSNSFHRKEAAILVVRAASGRGDCVKARAVAFRWLLPSPDAETRAALRGCDTAPNP